MRSEPRLDAGMAPSYIRAVLELLTSQLAAARPLTDEQVASAVGALTHDAVTAEHKADFLTALARKGETAGEIAAFARELRALSLVPPLDEATRAREILDVCGTGGDRLNTFNISTTVAIVCAAAGVTVAKHGNRAITSQSGSADVLEALGIRIDLTPEESAHALRERGFAFLFAQKFHPAFRNIGPARKLCAERGQRTIFNFLGPLLNPARPSAQLVGVSQGALCEPLGQVLRQLGVRRGMVVSGIVPGAGTNGGPAFLDELSTLGESTVAEFYHDRGFSVTTVRPEDFGVPPARLEDLAGGDRETNARIIVALLEGRERGPRRDAVLFNAGAALFVAGRARSLSEGWEVAREVLESGCANAKLRELRR